MEKVSINSEDAAWTQDRATVIIRAHYQEFEPNNMTSAYHAYDFQNPHADSPFQTTMKVGPSSRVPLNIGHLDPATTLLVLSHEKAKTTKAGGEILKEAMESNIINITNVDGLLVGKLKCRHAFVVEYPFPVFVQSTKATALLSVTAFPVSLNEKIHT
jgi:hypothetical protein